MPRLSLMVNLASNSTQRLHSQKLEIGPETIPTLECIENICTVRVVSEALARYRLQLLHALKGIYT